MNQGLPKTSPSLCGKLLRKSQFVLAAAGAVSLWQTPSQVIVRPCGSNESVHPHGPAPVPSSSAVLHKDSHCFFFPNPHLDLIWRPIGPHFLPLQAAPPSLRGQFCRFTTVHTPATEFIDHNILIGA